MEDILKKPGNVIRAFLFSESLKKLSLVSSFLYLRRAFNDLYSLQLFSERFEVNVSLVHWLLCSLWFIQLFKKN